MAYGTVPEQRAREILQPHEVRLQEAIEAAWMELQDSLPSVGPISMGVQSGLLRDFVLRNMRQAFDRVPGARFTKYRGLECLMIEDGEDLLRVKFKKLNGRLQPGKSHTQQTIDFNTQQLAIQGMGPATNFHVGWQLDRLRTELQGLWITCPDGMQLSYSWQIQGEHGASQAPLTRIQPQAPTPARRVTVKPEVARERNAEDANHEERSGTENGS